jgi:hypothetical protein
VRQITPDKSREVQQFTTFHTIGGRGLVRDRKVTPIPSFPSLAQHECRFRYVHIDIGRRYILEQCGVVPIRTYR